MHSNDPYGGRVPPEKVAPTIKSLSELEAYVEAYRFQRAHWSPEDVAAVQARKKELEGQNRP